jgi:hypothetical protein
MSGAIPLLLLYAFVGWTATNLPLPGQGSKWEFPKCNSEALHFEPYYVVVHSVALVRVTYIPRVYDLH